MDAEHFVIYGETPNGKNEVSHNKTSNNCKGGESPNENDTGTETNEDDGDHDEEEEIEEHKEEEDDGHFNVNAYENEQMIDPYENKDLQGFSENYKEIPKQFDSDVEGAAEGSEWDSEGKPLQSDSQYSSDYTIESEEDEETETALEDGDAAWNDNLRVFLDQEPEFRSKVQYQVRAVLLMPALEASGRKVSEFSKFYEMKFGRGIEATGFVSAANLCKAMPHVVQRKLLDEEEKLCLVESAKNIRICAGIKSGLRRIVFDILQLHPNGLTIDEFETKCSDRIKKPLPSILSEHAYENPSVESMVRDMLDIAVLRQEDCSVRMYLCQGAEDPCLTDGILIGNETFNSRETCTGNMGHQVLELKEALRLGLGYDPSHTEHSGNIKKFDNFDDDEYLQVRFRLVVLLAMYSDGIEISKLEEAYANLYSLQLNLEHLGFISVAELTNCWQDIICLQPLRPNFLFLLPSLQNQRIVNTLRTSLRSIAFSIFLGSYPESVAPYDFVLQLEKSLSGNTLEVLYSHGYISEMSGRNQSYADENVIDFQLGKHVELCLLLHDMTDFIRFGCQDDGSLVLKLRDRCFPLLDLPDSNDQLGRLTDVAGKVSLDKDELSGDDIIQQNITLDSCIPGNFSDATLRHQIRLVLGSSQYFTDGAALEEFIVTFRQRSKIPIEPLELNRLLCKMPDIVAITSGHANLVKSPQNLRILSVTMSGLRQVLYWALLKNPGGLWCDLLEGWYSDFTGHSLRDTLIKKHGYAFPKTSLLASVADFLDDMEDIVSKHTLQNFEYYTSRDGMDDPVPTDAAMLGILPLDIQYDPLREAIDMAAAETYL